MVEFKYIFVNWVRCSIATCLFAHYLEGISGFFSWKNVACVQSRKANATKQQKAACKRSFRGENSRIIRNCIRKTFKVTSARKTFNHMKPNEKMSQGY